MWQRLKVLAQGQGRSLVGERPPWRAKTVWVALAMVFLGGGLWVKDLIQQPPGGSPPSAAAVGDSTPGGAAGSSVKPAPNQPRAPATFRLGTSYLGGFFLGWVFRRFIKFSLLLSAAAIALVALGKKFGWLDLDWASLEGQVRQGVTWSHTEAGVIKQFLTGLLPSAFAAGAGVFLGFRRK